MIKDFLILLSITILSYFLVGKEFLIILVVSSTILLIIGFILKKIGIVMVITIEGYQYLLDTKSNKEALADCIARNEGKAFTRMNVSGVDKNGKTWFFPHLIQQKTFNEMRG